MKIAGLIKSSTIDFPGLLSAVLFSPGCNFDCFYCHNRPLLTGHAPLMEPAYVMNFLKRRTSLLDGVVLSGGEPTLQKDLKDMILSLRSLGYKIKLDTNGARPDVVQDLITENLVDYIAIDLKAPRDRYVELTDCAPGDVDLVWQSYRILADSKVDWEARTTVIPQLSDHDLLEMARSIPVAPNYFLQRYTKPAVYRPEDRFRLDVAAMTPSQLVLAADKIRPDQPNVLVR